jgi:hypothetical protein
MRCRASYTLICSVVYCVWCCVHVDRVGWGIGVLLRRWAITDTLDPVRGLLSLTVLSVALNSIRGMSKAHLLLWVFAGVVLGW